ncbi:orotidine-5'-phosphate decarboxylase [Jeotgalibacillus proteolyticus]|uniref:Orotidine 5'-phosphate decarboxylase n=1 Tax=Jeotgalibacillus proteolyticus TaxID=2082395 RepID=A0A2S5GHY8_9BACL|nr:orotidine-5'-phosphate decarboxylase [Jeotgalibacillus proteolyticus]PPA72483.1 orotidine-5'-phosphate decarboxylase [Jeotgalibacillus proteolyticus]
MEKQPIIALDFAQLEEVETFLQHFDEPLYVKVGMELYLQNGPVVIETIKKRNHRIFLDLKLHDIPTTVRKAMRGLAALEIDMINVHAAGGKKMMEEALAGLTEGAKAGRRPKLIAVTQLTSTSQDMLRNEQKSSLSMEESVLHYASLAHQAGLDGVVCSPLEARAIRELAGDSFMRVTPGIRPQASQLHDQVRVATPKAAMERGSSAIVVGRAITESADPASAYNKIQQEWEGVCFEKANS